MYTIVHNPLAAPSVEQLETLSKLPSGMLGRSSRGKGGGRGQRQARTRLVREGQIVSKLFNPVAARPQPNNGLQLQQSITLELEVTIPNFIVSSGTATLLTFASQAITLTQFAASSSLRAVFDQYRFEQVEAWLEVQAPNGTLSVPTVATAVDLDDANAPMSMGQVQDHLGAITSGGMAGHYHKWRPHTAVAVYSGAFTSFANAEAQWIDSASPGVEHYGFKAVTASTGGSFAFALTLRAVVSFAAPAIN